MSDVSDLSSKDSDSVDSFANDTVGQSGKPDGGDDLSSGGGWPIRALGRRATWRFFVQRRPPFLRDGRGADVVIDS
jgi:hypothetical protein